MLNPLRDITQSCKTPVYKVADQLGLSRATLVRLTAKDGLPRNVPLTTLDKVAAAYGYRVEVNFVPLEKG